MACGTPVVAAQTGGLVENVLDGVTGYLIPLRSSKLYAEKIDVYTPGLIKDVISSNVLAAK